MSNIKNLKTLGEKKTNYKYDKPDSSLLETFDNEHPDLDYTVEINAPEFTSLCPKTGQPDYATIFIEYKPDKLCVESKSLKLYLGSYRMHGEFHEDCVCRMLKDLRTLMSPKYIKITGKFMPRGCIAFRPIAEWGNK